MTSKKAITIRIIKWAGIVLGMLALLLSLAIWFANQEPVQKKIRDAVTSRLHDAVKFRRLDVALLPRPHVTIDRITVAAPGKVSGSVASAVIYPEFLPLLTGKLSIARIRLYSPDVSVNLLEEPGARPEDAQAAFAETRAGIESAITTIRGFAPDLVVEAARGKVIIESDGHLLSHLTNINGTVTLVRKGFDMRLRAEAARWGHVSINGALYVWRHSIAVRNLSLSGGRSSLSELSARFSWRKTPYLDVRSGQGTVALEDVYERRTLFGYLQTRLRNVKKMTGTIRLTEMNFVGPLLHEDQWKLQTAGTMEQIFVDSPVLPGPVRIGQGQFQATTNTVILRDTQATAMDSSVSGAASFVGPYNQPRSLAVSLGGRIGRKTIEWASKKFNVPPQYVVRAPLWLSRLHFTWEKGKITSAGTAALNRGPSLSFDLLNRPGELLIKRLMIDDEKERVQLALSRTAKALEISFNGKLSEETIKRVFERSGLDRGWVRGNFRAHIIYDNPRESSAHGILEARDVVVPETIMPALTVQHIVLEANNKTVSVNRGSFIWEDMPLDVKGRIDAGREGFRVDMDVNAGSITADSIKRAFSPEKKENSAAGGGNISPETAPRRAPLLGTIRFNAKDFVYGRYFLSPVTGNIFLDRNSVRVAITDASVCGISLPGHIQPLNGKILLDLDPAARAQQMEPVVACLSPKHHITGTFDLTGKLHALAPAGELARSLQGQVNFTAKDGKFYVAPILARIFAFLNLTEVLRGKVPDLGRDGFKYSSIKVTGDIRNGKLLLDQATVEGSTLNMAAEGEVDFGSNTIDITVLVAPFKTIEYILSKIPLLRNILANRLVTIPVRVSGDLNNPDVTPLDPEAIGQNLLNIMKGILELPFKIIEPLINRE